MKAAARAFASPRAVLGLCSLLTPVMGMTRGAGFGGDVDSVAESPVAAKRAAALASRLAEPVVTIASAPGDAAASVRSSVGCNARDARGVSSGVG